MDYQEPSWAVPPPPHTTWTLLEIKGGVEMASHSLHKPCTVLGRNAYASTSNNRLPAALIVLRHESCSRLHARIAFDGNGTPWLRDLSSVHGTTVNRRRLPSIAIGKQESTCTTPGSRGVMLFPGDILQFGASTRMYTLQGPSEYERGGRAVRMNQVEVNKKKNNVEAVSQAKATMPANETKEDEAEDQGFLWGMAVDTAEDIQATAVKKQLLPASNLDPSIIPDKHRKLYERLSAKRYKLENVQRESERILAKGELLSQGQEAQLQKNSERIQKWQEEIGQLEQELHEKVHPDETQKTLLHVKKRKSHQEDESSDDDYDFYDRTKDNETDLFVEDGETQESLVNKWKELLGDWKQCSKSLQGTLEKVQRLSQRIQAADPNDEDTFFLQNDLDLQKDSLQKEQERKLSIAHNLTETERLLRVVNANLEFDRETGFVGEPETQTEESVSVKKTDDAAMMPPPVSFSSPMSPKLTSSPAANMCLPPPRVPSPIDNIMLPPPARLSMPPPKRTRVVGPTMPPSPDVEVEEKMPPPQRNTAHAAHASPIMGTLSVLSAAASTTKSKKEKHGSPKQQKKPSSASFDPKRDVWKAPKDQDGSGMTKLNAKFAGRY